METLAGMLPLLLILLLLLMLFRRNQTMRRQQAETQQALVPGVEVMTTSGLFARVSSVEDDAVVLEVSPSTLLRFHRQAIARVVSSPTGDPAAPDQS